MPVGLIIGGAEGVWDDVAAALKLFTPDAFFVINDALPVWPRRVDYAITLHPEKLRDWLRQRRINGYSDVGEVWSHRSQPPYVQRRTNDWAGSSGLFAVKVAIEEGFDGVVLAGVPMQAEGKHFVRRIRWTDIGTFAKAWDYRFPEISSGTRSMSGWTKSLLGGPTVEWLASLGATTTGHELAATLETGDAHA